MKALRRRSPAPDFLQFRGRNVGGKIRQRRAGHIAYARLRARPPASLRRCLAPALRASLIAYKPIAYKRHLL